MDDDGDDNTETIAVRLYLEKGIVRPESARALGFSLEAERLKESASSFIEDRATFTAVLRRFYGAQRGLEAHMDALLFGWARRKIFSPRPVGVQLAWMRWVVQNALHNKAEAFALISAIATGDMISNALRASLNSVIGFRADALQTAAYARKAVTGEGLHVYMEADRMRRKNFAHKAAALKRTQVDEEEGANAEEQHDFDVATLRERIAEADKDLDTVERDRLKERLALLEAHNPADGYKRMKRAEAELVNDPYFNEINDSDPVKKATALKALKSANPVPHTRDDKEYFTNYEKTWRQNVFNTGTMDADVWRSSVASGIDSPISPRYPEQAQARTVTQFGRYSLSRYYSVRDSRRGSDIRIE